MMKVAVQRFLHHLKMVPESLILILMNLIVHKYQQVQLIPKKESDGPMSPWTVRISKKSKVINFDLEINPGLYCIDGDLTIHSDSLVADNVTLFMKTGSLTINAGSTLTLTAPTAVSGSCTPGCPPALENVLVDMPHGNVGLVQINGNSDFTIGGTIYAPDSHVKLNGNADAEDG